MLVCMSKGPTFVATMDQRQCVCLLHLLQGGNFTVPSMPEYLLKAPSDKLTVMHVAKGCRPILNKAIPVSHMLTAQASAAAVLLLLPVPHPSTLLSHHEQRPERPHEGQHRAQTATQKAAGQPDVIVGLMLLAAVPHMCNLTLGLSGILHGSRSAVWFYTTMGNCLTCMSALCSLLCSVASPSYAPLMSATSTSRIRSCCSALCSCCLS